MLKIDWTRYGRRFLIFISFWVKGLLILLRLSVTKRLLLNVTTVSSMLPLFAQVLPAHLFANTIFVLFSSHEFTRVLFLIFSKTPRVLVYHATVHVSCYDAGLC